MKPILLPQNVLQEVEEAAEYKKYISEMNKNNK